MLSKIVRTLLSGALAVVLGGAAGHSLFNGTWQLNTAKSKFESPGRKSQKVVITDDLTSVETVLADGTQQRWSYKLAEGKDIPITGMDNSHVSAKFIDDRTVQHTWKMDKNTSQGKGVLLQDGKTMTYTLTGKTPEGKAYKDVMVFEKEVDRIGVPIARPQ